MFQAAETVWIAEDDTLIRVKNLLRVIGGRKNQLLSGGEFAALGEEKVETFYKEIFPHELKNITRETTRYIKFKVWLCRQTDFMFTPKSHRAENVSDKGRKRIMAEIETTKI
jgi:hypothetical protein